MGQAPAGSWSLARPGAFHEFLNPCRNVAWLDAKFGCSPLAVGLRLAELVSDHDRFHDLQGGPQIGRPVATTEVINQLVQDSAILGLDGKAESLCSEPFSSWS
jgi:hypothetical protein